jgi:2-polyprenyl-3-methyl-5-hydroxy-6-metoxy-1,4-benzoquinol methylase
MGELFKKELPNNKLLYSDERFTEGHGLETEIEHYHRYFFARSYCRGKDVLDIASGEGYGSAILAQVASSVVGVDICEEAVRHAQKVHTRPNLNYRTGDVRKIPLDDHCVDIIISFETLEHFYEHDLFMQEAKRVLRPNGFMMISTPNSDIYSAIGIPANPYHVNELTKIEFTALCKKYFKHINLLNQRTVVGSILINETQTSTIPLLFESRDQEYIEGSKGLSRAHYLISILSDSDTLLAPNSIYIHEHVGKLLKNYECLEDKDRHIKNLESMLLDKGQRTVHLENILNDKEQYTQDLENTLNHKKNHIEELEYTLLEKEHYVRMIQGGRKTLKNSLFEPFIFWLRTKIFNKTTIELCEKSTLFDRNWYLTQYPDVHESGINPVKHYVKIGAAEGRDPGPNFSTKGYLIKNPKIYKKGINPLVHFEKLNKNQVTAID